MIFGPNYNGIAAVCLRVALLILPALVSHSLIYQAPACSTDLLTMFIALQHTAIWGTRFIRDLPKLSNPK